MKKTIAIFILALVSAVAFTGAYAQSTTRTRVATIGDSITYGAGLKDRFTQSWPMLLAKMLGDNYEVRNFGYNSRTASAKGDYPYLEAKKYDTLKMWLPDVVTIMLGTNDSKPHNWNSEEYREGCKTIVNQLRNLPSHPKIFLLTPTPTWDNAYGISNEVIRDEELPILREVASGRWLDVVDLYTPFVNDRQYFTDGVHPNREGHEEIAKVVYDEFRQNGLTGTPGMRVLFIGDSITDGDWAKRDAKPSNDRNHYDMNHIYGHGWQSNVAQDLLLKYPERHLHFYNRGVSGNKLTDLAKRWDNDVMSVRPDVVSILVGINDTGHHTVEDFDFEGWEKLYRQLIDTTLSVNPKTKFVLCTPFYGGDNQIVVKLADIVRSLAKEYDCAMCVDFAKTIADLQKNDKSSDRHYWLWDKIHPTYPAHRVLANQWLKEVKWVSKPGKI